MVVCCECCVLSGRGLFDELITYPKESYRLWRVVVWPRNFVKEEAMAHWGLSRQNKQTNILHYCTSHYSDSSTCANDTEHKKHSTSRLCATDMCWTEVLEGVNSIVATGSQSHCKNAAVLPARKFV
jgi:hypothetical protein